MPSKWTLVIRNKERELLTHPWHIHERVTVWFWRMEQRQELCICRCDVILTSSKPGENIYAADLQNSIILILEVKEMLPKIDYCIVLGCLSGPEVYVWAGWRPDMRQNGWSGTSWREGSWSLQSGWQQMFWEPQAPHNLFGLQPPMTLLLSWHWNMEHTADSLMKNEDILGRTKYFSTSMPTRDPSPSGERVKARSQHDAVGFYLPTM